MHALSESSLNACRQTLGGALIFVLVPVALLVVCAVIGASILMDTEIPVVPDLNVTTIQKTDMNWPLKGLMTSDACGYRRCYSI